MRTLITCTVLFLSCVSLCWSSQILNLEYSNQNCLNPPPYTGVLLTDYWSRGSCVFKGSASKQSTKYGPQFVSCTWAKMNTIEAIDENYNTIDCACDKLIGPVYNITVTDDCKAFVSGGTSGYYVVVDDCSF
jgi:hypothetical protein